MQIIQAFFSHFVEIVFKAWSGMVKILLLSLNGFYIAVLDRGFFVIIS